MMNRLGSVKLMHENGEPYVILDLQADIYWINQVELIRHDSLKAIHEYQAVINGVDGRLVINCGLTPPVCILGSFERAIDHHIQDAMIEALSQATQALVAR